MTCLLIGAQQIHTNPTHSLQKPFLSSCATAMPIFSQEDAHAGCGSLGTTWQGWGSSPRLAGLCSLLCHPIPLQLVTVGCQRGMNQQAGFKNQSNPPIQGQTQVELHRVFSKRPPEPFCSSLLSPCSSQCTCERNN